MSAGKQIHERTGKTFYAGTKFLPERMREHTYAIYGFVRTADDFVDTWKASGHEQRKAIEDYRRRTIEAIREPESCTDPILGPFAKTVRACKIPELDIHTFLDAMAADTVKKQYKDIAELEGYMRGSATAVGYMMLHVTGYTGDRETVRKQARALAEAFQMTNFLRDVREDQAKLGRVYLPLTTLHKHGSSVEEVAKARMTPALRKAMHELALWNRNRYHDGALGIKHLAKDARFGVLLATALYLHVLEKIEAADYDVFTRRLHLTRAEKARITLRTWWRYRFLKRGELQTLGIVSHA